MDEVWWDVMKLTDKELEVMIVLWENEHPMTATELIKTSSNRTWKESSIYTILNTLVRKGAVVLTHYKPTMTNAARAYKPVITSEDYTVSNIEDMIKTGVRIDIPTLVAHLMDIKER